MKLLLDANLSPEVGRRLKEAGHDAIHVGDIGLLSAPDPEILQTTVKEERISPALVPLTICVLLNRRR